MTMGADRPLIWIGGPDYGCLPRAIDRPSGQAPEGADGSWPKSNVTFGSQVAFAGCDTGQRHCVPPLLDAGAAPS